MTNESKGMLLGLGGVFSFGLTLPVTRYVVDYFNPTFIGLGRAVVATFFAASLLLITKQPFPTKNQIFKLTITSIGVVVGFPIFSAIAMQTVPASHGGVVLGILPLVTAIFGALIAGEKPSFGFWISGVIGTILVTVYSILHGANTLYTGDFALLCATISAALGYAIGGKLSKEIGGWQVICWSLVIAFPFIVTPAFLKAPRDWLYIPFSVWLAFLYLALFSQLIGFFFWNKGLALGGISRVSQIQFIQPFVTIVASAFLIGELLELNTIIFSILVVSTVAIGKTMPIRERV